MNPEDERYKNHLERNIYHDVVTLGSIGLLVLFLSNYFGNKD